MVSARSIRRSAEMKQRKASSKQARSVAYEQRIKPAVDYIDEYAAWKGKHSGTRGMLTGRQKSKLYSIMLNDNQ